MSDGGTVRPSGVVTFLFTDIEGSTRRWEADPEKMQRDLATHDEVLRNAISTHGGWIFKHTGDGVCAVFDSPRSAVDAAVAAQLALELPVRMGIATGEAEARGEDYFGPVLNRAARVMAVGHGGQILLGEWAARMLNGVDLINLGRHRLRDLPYAMVIYQVRAEGLRTEFPPLKCVHEARGNLRPSKTTLVGREAELADIEATLRASRLLTLTGSGGVGKTRLAREVAIHLESRFGDGSWFIDLATVSDPAAVPAAVAAVLGMSQRPGKSLSESLAEGLDGGTHLLILDNCEHVLDAAADLVEAILSRSTTVTILATSREGLGVAEEHLWPVPALDVAAGVHSAAVNLFVQRARNVARGFALKGSEDEVAVVEICRRLDGIPLAIELAASRSASMSVLEVRDRLDQRFRLLVGSRRGAARHQTLRHAVAWSFHHLGEEEKQLIERCSVITGGFDLECACAVAGSDHQDEFVVLDMLDALVRKSLLKTHRSSSGRTRFTMLETIRAYAEEQLAIAGGAVAARAAYAQHFAAQESSLALLWNGPRQQEAYTWFTTELPNLRSAFRWSADEGELDLAATIATYASFLGIAVAHLEPIAWAEELIPAARAVDHPRLAVLQIIASQCWMYGRYADAVAYADEAHVTVAKNPERKLPFVEGLLNSAYVVGGRAGKAVDCYRARLAAGHDPSAANSVGLALALVADGRAEEAVRVADDLLVATGTITNPYALTYAALAYGYAYFDRDPVAAREVVRRGVVTAQESGNRTNGTNLVVALSRLEARHGDPLDALDYLISSIARYHDAGNSGNLSTGLALLAIILDRFNRHESAATIMGFAVNSLTRVTFPEIAATIAHLRDVLGERRYETLTHAGKAMRIAPMVEYAYDQIKQLRDAIAVGETTQSQAQPRSTPTTRESHESTESSTVVPPA
ncbi:MAG: adenylate/guanylate cyclase domain-containing protein [Mycolicibacterium sp.]|uniref:ATP-binding protein n=1 Tax=Mycolicibacterium sp. TaxID=2320850 RepID=UPI003D132E0B